MNDANSHEAVFIWTLHNFQRLKVLLEPIKLQREELLADQSNKGLESDIEKQFRDALKSTLTLEIAKGLTLPADEVATIVEDINFEEFLK